MKSYNLVLVIICTAFSIALCMHHKASQKVKNVRKANRYFIAADIPLTADNALKNIQESIKRKYPAIFKQEKKLHITLAFLGNLDEATLQNVNQALRSIKNIQQITGLTLQEADNFGAKKSTNVILLQPNDGLTALADIIRSSITPVLPLANAQLMTSRDFKAHITLGKKITDNISDLVPVSEIRPFAVDSFTIYISKKNGNYIPVYTYSF